MPYHNKKLYKNYNLQEKKLVKNEVFKDEKGNAFIYDKKTGKKV